MKCNPLNQNDETKSEYTKTVVNHITFSNQLLSFWVPVCDADAGIPK